MLTKALPQQTIINSKNKNKIKNIQYMPVSPLAPLQRKSSHFNELAYCCDYILEMGSGNLRHWDGIWRSIGKGQ